MAATVDDQPSGSQELDQAAVISNTKVLDQQRLKLTDAQRARIERNRQKALLLKQARLASRPYTLEKPDRSKTKMVPMTIDTGAGFFIEETDNDEHNDIKVVHPKGAMLGTDYIICEECGKDFMDSYLYTTFTYPVCDECRDSEEKHRLITKSDAKDTYLLKDADFDKREPALKFIVKKNPRNQRWGDMKLYLEIQVYDRAMEIWESEEKLQEKQDEKVANREKTKQKRFDKKVKDLRMAVRSSLWKKDTGVHEHVYSPEEYDEEDDTYTKSCTECGHKISYEKM